MQNHWPLIAAAIMISIAVALGLLKHDAVVESAGRRPAAPVAVQTGSGSAASAPDTAAPATPLPAEQVAPSEGPKSPAPLSAPKDIPPRPAVAAPAQPQAAPPAHVAVQPVQPLIQQAAPAAPPPAAQPAAAPQPKFSVPSAQPPAVALPPKAAVAAPKPPKPEVPGDALGSLRAKLETQLAMQASNLAAGGYAFQLDGARIEVQGLPNWSVVIWNINPVKEQAEAETDNFKKLYQIAAAELGFDPNQKGVTLGNGSTSLQTTSKLGNLTVVQDPAKGNSATIQPNQRRIPPAQAAPAQPVQVAPAQAVQAPVQAPVQVAPAQPAPVPAQAAPAQPAPAPAPAPQPAAENKAAPAPAPAQPQPAAENRAAPAPAPAPAQPQPNAPQPPAQNWVNNSAPGK